MNNLLSDTLARVAAPDAALLAAARHKMDYKTKPLGALGRLEDCAVRLCLMQGRLDPAIERKSLVVFAGDHGVAREGVSAFPAEVTPQMVHNFLSGGAAINVLCRQQDIALRVADIGVDADFADHPRLLKLKVRRGTANLRREPAMSRADATAALEAGIAAFAAVQIADRPDIVAAGEMGIGNTTSASALISAWCGISAREAAGRGTGIDDSGLERKIGVIEDALTLHRPDPADPLGTLAALGGLEIAAIAGFALAAAAARVPIVLDGLISTAGGLAAAELCPAAKAWMFSGHRSVERGQAAALAKLGLEPLVDLGLRLGEGTGAALAIGFIDAAARVMSEMASFEDAGVSGKA